MPANESFKLEYVTNKSWSGYNWYQGNASSLIQINTDLPIFIDRAVDLAAHEGYPGHHVLSTLLEQKLMKGRGWMEFSINPLFGPNGVIAEGSANYGIDVVFPGGERPGVRAQGAVPAGRARSAARGGVLPRARNDQEAQLRRQRRRRGAIWMARSLRLMRLHGSNGTA